MFKESDSVLSLCNSSESPINTSDQKAKNLYSDISDACKMIRKQIRRKFLYDFEALSVRARHILQSQKLDDFESFYNIIIEKGVKVDFMKVRNCGVNTERELFQFIKE